MRVFVTGATGFIGSAVIRELIASGHEVIGLARSEAASKSLIAHGAKAHRGTIEDLECLRRGAKAADGAIHLAYFHAFSHASLSMRMRVMFGGAPSGIVSRFMAAAVKTDRRAIETIALALNGSDRPIVVAFPTMALTPGRLATEESSADPKSVGGPRALSEVTTMKLSTQKVRASLVRLPPSVHGNGDHGLVWSLINTARKKGFSAYVGNGQNRWAAVHQSDAAHLFTLALENGAAGAKYHAVAEQGMPFRQIAEIIGEHLKVPVVSKSPKEAEKIFGFLAPFVSADNPVSSELTQERLGWHPEGSGLIMDLKKGGYFKS